MAKAKKKKQKTKKKKQALSLPPFDKYRYYSMSVQSPENDVIFLRDQYKALTKKKPKTMREDFCGTFANSCEWIKLDPTHEAYGVDLDPEPLAYGQEHYLSKLTPDQAKRLHLKIGNVLESELAKVDIVCALNFSYFIFKTREVLRKYFTRVYQSLNEGGVFFIDCFGGSACSEANEEETEYEDNQYSYFWDQDSFDPVTNFATFYIHFKRKGEKKRERVFTYDWRMWSIPELREILAEAGFKSTHAYWEGTDKNGEGDGEFKIAETGEECQSWVSYIAARK